MASNPFNYVINLGVAAVGAQTYEAFEVVRAGKSGSWMALSIDDMSQASGVIPGGSKADNKTLLFVLKTVVEAAEIRDGTILLVRNKRVEVETINDDGDNSYMLTCGSTGVSL